jgi:hypothetical protein
MDKTVQVESHETLYLKQGWYFALGFREGWLVGRVTQKTWSTLQPWAFGPVAAGGNLAVFDEIQDNSSRHFLEPYQPGIIYHSFWGVTPSQAQVKWQYPVRTDLGSMLNVARTLTDNVGIIDGYKSPFWGPYNDATELFTVKDQYPAFQIYNPTSDPITNVMLNIDQRQYTYSVVKDKQLIKSLLTGDRQVKKYTMGTVPLQLEAPGWLVELVTADIFKYTLDVMSGKVV